MVAKICFTRSKIFTIVKMQKSEASSADFGGVFE